MVSLTPFPGSCFLMGASLLTLFLLFLPNSQAAQTAQLHQKVVANSGGYWQAIDNSPGFTFTLGETFTGSARVGNTVFTKGFQQTRIIEFPVVTSALWQHRITLFPNPAVEYVRLRFDLPEATSFTIILYSSLGQQVSTWSHTDQQGVFTADIEDLRRGTYHLSAFDQDAARVASFTFIKQ